MGRGLREGWELKSLKEIGETQTGNTPATKEVDNYGSFIPFVKPAHFKTDGSIDTKDSALSEKGLKSARLFKKNSILMVCIGATIGKTGFSEIAVTSNQQINAFTPPKEFEAKFFYYLFITDYFQNKIMQNSAQATLPIINKSKWENILVSFPKRKEEQEKIVAILDEAFSAIAKAKANAELNLQNAKELFESYLQGVFENKGEGWEEISLGELGKASMCKRILKNQTSITGDIPFYKIGTFGKTSNAFISKDLYNEYRDKYSFPKKGDILISASGTIGRRVVYDGKPAYFQDSNIVWIDNNEQIVLNNYLYCFYGYCNWNPSKGATIARLYNYNLREIKISFPKSLTEQKQIVKNLNTLQEQTKKLESIYTQKLQDLEELKKSILQKAFNGELT